MSQDQLRPFHTALDQLRPVHALPDQNDPTQVTGAQACWPTAAGPQPMPVHTEPLKVPPVQLRCALDAAVQTDGTEALPKMSCSPASAVPVSES